MDFSPRSIFSQLGHSDISALRGVSEELDLDPGAVLWRRGDRVDAAYVVLAGHLVLGDESGETTEAGPGEAIDELLLLTGGNRTSWASARDAARVLRMPLDSIHQLLTEHPALLDDVSTAISRQLRSAQLREELVRLFGRLDRAAEDELTRRVEWLELTPGEVLFRQHESADALYLLMDGILGAWAEANGADVLLNEIAAGETIGEMALIGGGPRSATVKAIKPSLLIRLGKAEFEAIAADHPIVYKAFAEVLVGFLERSRAGRGRLGGAREIALLPHGSNPELLTTVTKTLAERLGDIGPTLHLSVARLHAMGDRFPFDVGQAVGLPLLDPANTRFSAWLTQQRKQFEFVLYETDQERSAWSRLCIDRADEIVLVADASASPSPGSLERSLAPRELLPQRLVLVHADSATPTETRRWLASRRLAGHHHIRLGRKDDLARVARFLAQRAIGLVLAGGGARGFAHIGAIQAFHGAGIPIDTIGGTSSGAMAALTYAMEMDPEQLVVRNQRDWVDKRPWHKYAPPVLSILNHRSWDRIFRDGFGDVDIEDLWIPAFCVSSNIDRGRMVVHSSGPAWKAVRASTSLPALLAPVLFDGEAHVDGGLVNNLPTDVMRARTAGTVIAVSLGQRAADAMPFDVYPSPWKLARSVLNPFKRSGPMHTVPKVMLQIAVLGDLARAEQRSSETDVVLEPPVSDIPMTDFSDVDGTIRIGYDYTIDRLKALADDEAFVARMRSAGIEFAS